MKNIEILKQEKQTKIDVIKSKDGIYNKIE